MISPILGQIQPFGFSFPPKGWALCEGQLLSIAQNTALFSLLGTTYGGNGQTTFALPDLRGRFIVHPGTGPGLDSIEWGEVGGSQTHTMLMSEIPSHNHGVTVLPGSTARGSVTSSTANGNYLGNLTDMYRNPAASSGSLAGGMTGATGGNVPFSLVNPLLGIYLSIAMVGIFPSRN